MQSEREIAGLTGMKKTAGSGCGLIQKGDVGDTYWHIEDKSTRNRAIQLKRAWLEKARDQSQKAGKKYWAVSLTFTTRFHKWLGPTRFFLVACPLTELSKNQMVISGQRSITVGPQNLVHSVDTLADMLSILWLVDGSPPISVRVFDEAEFVVLLKELRHNKANDNRRPDETD